MSSPISVRPYGTIPAGQPVEAWTLTGRGGLAVEFITLGGIVTRLLVPDRNGVPGDVVLGLGSLDAYLAGHPYFGAIAGRVSGRTTGATFALDGRIYQLARNDAPNHLHGGICGFDKRIWKVTRVLRPDNSPCLRLSYSSPAGEEGYPGNVEVSVTYAVTDENNFLIESEAVSDQVTPLNLTHHSYFNLSGEGRNFIADHRLTIFADKFVPAGEYMTLSGQLEPVTQGNDFRSPRRLGDMVPMLFQQHGDLYMLPQTGDGAMNLAARLEDPASGRVLTVSTTNTHLQLYTGRSLDGSIVGKSGASYGPYAGLCLECEGYPDAANQELREGILLHPGQPQRHAIAYAFSVGTKNG